LQEKLFFECASKIQIADLRVPALTVAIDTAIALLQPIRIVRQIEMDQIEAPLLQIQPFGQRVSADQNNSILFRATHGDVRPRSLAVDSIDG